MALDTAVPNSLESLIMSPAQQQAYKQNLINRAMLDINREAGNSTQAALENAFARGVGTSSGNAGQGVGGTGQGLSSISAYNASQIERARADAIEKAGMDAESQVQAAQRAAIGQAAGYLNAQRQRDQSAYQFNQNQKLQKSMNTNNMLMQGLGGLAGGALKFGGNVATPALQESFKKMFGSAAGKGDAGYAGPSGQGPGNVQANEQQTPFTPETSNIAAAAQVPQFDNSPIDLTQPSYGDYSTPSYGGYDFSSYNPADFGFNLSDLLRSDSSNDWFA